MWYGPMSENAERVTSPTSSIVWEVKHVGQKRDGINCRLPRSNGGEFDHCFGILQHDELDLIVRKPGACTRAG